MERLVSPWLDGELDEERARQLELHLGSCAQCAAARRELTAMIDAARALPSPEPPSALWTRIDARLDEPVRSPSWWQLVTGRRLRFAVPVLAAVALATGIGLSLRTPAPSDDALLADAQTEFGKAESHYRRAVDDLRVLATRERDRWPDERRAHFDQALAALDQAMERSRDATRARPADPEAQEQLFSAYRRQIAFLEESLLRGAAVER
jgi:hypothetical protein